MIKKEKYSILLGDSDRIVIQSLMGRKPSELELEFLAMVRHNELLNRPYLETMRRLDEGARRAEKPAIPLDEDHLILVSGGTKILSPKGTITHNFDLALRYQTLHRSHPLVFSMELKTDPALEIKLIQRALTQGRANNVDVMGGQTGPACEGNNIFHSTIIGVVPRTRQPLHELKVGAIINRLTVGRSWTTPKSDRLIALLIEQLTTHPWFYGMISVDKKGLGFALVNLFHNYSLGLSVMLKGLSQENLLNELGPGKAEDILIICQSGFENEINDFFHEAELNCIQIGIIQKDPLITISSEDRKIVSFSNETFDFPWRSYSPRPSRRDTESRKRLDLKLLAEPKNYSIALKKLIPLILDKGKSWDLAGKRIGEPVINLNHGLISKTQSTGERIVITMADNDYFTHLGPRVGGRLTVTNAIRQLVCRGAKPISVSIQNVFPDPQYSAKSWMGIEVLQGQEEAIRILDLSIGDRQIVALEDVCTQHVAAAGYLPQRRQPMTREFKNAGDFISILGSHRGELGGSAYVRHIHGEYLGLPPSVDLTMESRIQETILLGINNYLIKSASNVSRGGLAVTIATCLMSGKEGFGARIHISRKIRNDELLFGETQGLVIISLAEEDIMEFERVCMTVGVPSTTIGRVTDDGRYTFNDLIDVEIAEIRELMSA